MSSAIVESAAVFDAGMTYQYLIDHVEVTCSLRHGLVPPRAKPSEMGMKSLQAYGRRKHMGQMRCTIERGEFKANQALSYIYFDSKIPLTSVITFNVNRNLKAELLKSGRYNVDARFSNQLGNNFVDPSAAPNVDLHQESLKCLDKMTGDAREFSTEIFSKLFAPPSVEVKCSIKYIELCWDVPCESAHLASTLWWWPWHDSFRRVRTGAGPYDSRDIEIWKGEDFDRDLAREAAGGLTLSAKIAEGERYKLYPKHERRLRYEASFSGERITKILGHSLRLDSPHNTKEDLDFLAKRAFKKVPEAQHHLLSKADMEIEDLIALFMRSGRQPEKAKEILTAFRLEGKFHNKDERCSAILGKLESQGAVEDLDQGVWAPSGSLRKSLLRFGMMEAPLSCTPCEDARATSPLGVESESINAPPVAGAWFDRDSHQPQSMLLVDKGSSYAAPPVLAAISQTGQDLNITWFNDQLKDEFQSMGIDTNQKTYSTRDASTIRDALNTLNRNDNSLELYVLPPQLEASHAPKPKSKEPI